MQKLFINTFYSFKKFLKDFFLLLSFIVLVFFNKLFKTIQTIKMLFNHYKDVF